MATQISVPYTILTDSGIQEGNPLEGAYAVVKFKCATSDRIQFVKDLMGTAVPVANKTAVSIVRTYPFAYPFSPNLICRGIESIEQIGRPYFFGLLNGVPWVGRATCIVTARFEYAPFFADNTDPSGKPYTQTTFNCSGQIQTAPQSTYKFASDNAPTNTPVGITIPEMQISMKRFMLPYPPVAEVANLTGKVNQSTVAIGDFAFQAGYLLFLGGNVTISSDTQGNQLWECDYQMAYRPYPWNSAIRPDGTGWGAIQDANGNPPYASGDFNSLP
jgi:hypothetical protein